MRKSVTAILESDPGLTIFLSIIKLAGLYDMLDGEGQFTVLAPDNNAFEKLTAPVYSKLINESRQKLKRIILYHILEGSYRVKDFVHGSKLETMNGNDLNVTVNDNMIKLNESIINTPDRIASNGVVHLLDKMM